jgi:hypothetical protein
MISFEVMRPLCLRMFATVLIQSGNSRQTQKKLTGFPVSYTNYHNNLAIS